jgi:cysteine desulfurase/selenocysteine lyase
MNKEDFPLLKNLDLVYLNSAATTQKPQTVIDSIKDFYEKYNSNVGRGSDKLSLKAGKIYDESREEVAKFIGGKSEEVVFVKSCTEAINLVANGIDWKKGDKVVIGIDNHHSNLVPWKMLESKGVSVEILDVDNDGNLIIDEEKIKIARMVAISHMSNVTGIEHDIKNMSSICKKHKCMLLVDAAQSIGHINIDVKEIGCDFLCFSGHKMLAPNGVGAIWSNKLDKLKPLIYGGEMISDVSLHEIKLKDNYEKFEGGTQNVAGAYALVKAIYYLNQIGLDKIKKQINELSDYVRMKLENIDSVKIFFSNNGIVSFNLDGMHAHDVAEYLNSKNIIVRAGHMCCQPLMERFGLSAGVIRASFYLYNSKEDADALVDALRECKEFFGK